jgi:hypothetical protein
MEPACLRAWFDDSLGRWRTHLLRVVEELELLRGADHGTGPQLSTNRINERLEKNNEGLY